VHGRPQETITGTRAVYQISLGKLPTTCQGHGQVTLRAVGSQAVAHPKTGRGIGSPSAIGRNLGYTSRKPELLCVRLRSLWNLSPHLVTRARTVAVLDQPDWYLALTVGMFLGAAVLAGQLARILHLPSVTAYLLVGLALGPHTPLLKLTEWAAEQLGYSISLAGHHIPAEHLAYLEPVGKFAIALVLFNIGCRFPLSSFRRILKRLLPISLGELVTTMVLVTGGLWLLGMVRTDTGLNWQTAVLFGALALATAPATTVLVLKESRSEGPLTEFTTGLVALNNLASIVVFELLFVVVHAARGADTSIGVEYLELTRDLIAASVFGMVAGLAVSFLCGIVAIGVLLIYLACG